MPYCAMLKHGITVGPLGNVRPCCKFDNKNLDRDFNSDWRTTFDEFAKRSETQWLEECKECQIAEQEGKHSFRQFANDTLGDIEHGIGYWDLKINNTCNYACVMCDPTSSNKWMQQVEQNGELDWPPYIKNSVKYKRSSWYKDFMPNIQEQLWDAKHIKFTGGEPFLIPQVQEIISWLYDNDISPGVELSIITNGSHEIESDLEEQLATFKHVHLMVSIDGIGNRFEYIRKNSCWNIVESNIEQFIDIAKETKNMTVSANFLPMALNAACQEETKQWAINLGLNWNQDIEIQDPSYLGYASLHPDLRQKYNIKTSTPYSEEQFDMMVKQMHLQDKIHGTDFQTECPEFF